MRRALIILPEAPYPAIGGGPLRTASILESLAKSFEITAAHFRLAGEPDPAQAYPPGLLTASHTLDLPHHSKAFLPRLARNLVRAARGIPPLVDRFSGQDLAHVLTGQPYDLIWLEHIWLAPYASALRPHTGKLVVDLHNVESSYYESLAASSPAIHRPLLRQFARKSREAEQRLLPLFDLVLATSEDDARRIAHPNIRVLPNTIPLHPVPQSTRSESLAFTGNFAYTPNQQALAWFLERVWPELLRARPQLRLRLIGKEIHYAYTSAPNIDYIGPVPDAIPAIAESQVAIVPLQSGSGTRLKILEAFASSTPVVSTTIGAEGLELAPSRHFLLADSPSQFAQSIRELLENENVRSRLATAARELYEQRYTWQSAHAVLSRLDL